MLFVNQYISSDLVFKYSQEFVEKNQNVLYSIGATKEVPVIVKSNVNGTTIWQREIRINDSEVSFYKLIPINFKDQSAYVVYGSNEKNHYLIAIDLNGNLLWGKQINIPYPTINAFLVEEVSLDEFFFVYSDQRETKSGNKDAFVLHFKATGSLIRQVSLRVNSHRNRGLIINAVQSYKGGLVLGGTLISKEPMAVVIDLDNRLKTLNVQVIQEPFLELQDLLVYEKGNYTISAYSKHFQSVVIMDLSRASVFYLLPDSREQTSLLCKKKDGFYCAVHNSEATGVVYKFKDIFTLESLKCLQYEKTSLIFQSINYLNASDSLTITTRPLSLLMHTNALMDSCITKRLEEVRLDKEELKLVKADVLGRSTRIEISNIRIGLEKTISKIKTICSSEPPCVKNKKICALHANLQNLYINCFSAQLSGEQIDYTSPINCANSFLGALNNFNRNCPEYNLANVLAQHIQSIYRFIQSPNQRNYQRAQNAMLAILSYLFNLGDCDCDEGNIFTFNEENTALQSSHFYLQAAGSTGVDSTKGIHLRWLLRGALSQHLPKGNYAIPNALFNKANDFVKIYRVAYEPVTIRLSLTTAPTTINDNQAYWLYSVNGEVFYVYFRNKSRYTQVRSMINPAINPSGFLQNYGSALIEIENKTQLSFAATLKFNVSANPSTVNLEFLSVSENTFSAAKKVSLRQTVQTNDLSGKQLLSENIRSIRLSATNAVLLGIDFEFYSHFVSRQGSSWEYLGKHALTKDTNVAYQRLEPQTNAVHGKWLRYNEAAYVNINNYKAKWNAATLDPDERILNTVDTYINLSNDPTNPTAIETIYFNDPNATPIPGFEPDDDFDPSENQFDLSNLYVLQLAALDYHIARMLGVGVLDLDTKVFSGQYIYLAEYITLGDLGDGQGRRAVQHVYCSLPTGLNDQRLPLPVDLKAPVPGIFQGIGTETQAPITDTNGYSADGKTRFLSLFHEKLPEELENDSFYNNTYEFISAESTIPVYAGIEYKVTGSSDWRKPELPFNSKYLNIDTTVPNSQKYETRSIVLPDLGYPLFVHREKQGGWHDYSSYGINWFSRAVSSTIIHSIETNITPTNTLQPPTNINAVLIREESPLLLTSANEQIEFSNISNTDKTFIRLAFDYHHGQEMINYQKEINGDLINGYSELADNQELFAENIEIFFRNEVPYSLSGNIVSVIDHSNPLLAVVTTGDYVVNSNNSVISPMLPSLIENNFIGATLTVNGATFVIHLVDNTGAYPKFTVFKNDPDGFPIALGSTTDISALSSPSTGELFIAVENMLSTSSWNSPGPLSFKVNIDHTTVHREEVIVKIPDGTRETHVQKFRGIYENALIEKFLEDHDGDELDGVDPTDTPKVHLGIYKLTFSSYALAQHSQANGTLHQVEWSKGLVRVHTTNNPNGPRKALQVIRTENIGTTANLVLYAIDTTFDGSDPNYDPVAIGTHQVNYYPSYKAYLYEDTTHGVNETNILPPSGQNIRYSIFGLRSHDTQLGYHSKISQPILMFAQRMDPPLQPRQPLGGLYATRPDFFGKASYTFTTKYDHKPYSVQFGRASDIQILTALWRNDEPSDPTIWTVARIKEEIFENGQSDWFVDRWKDLIGLDYAANGGGFVTLPDGLTLPMPNSTKFIASINVFIDNHNNTFSTAIPPIAAITSLHQIVIPASTQNAELQVVDFMKDVIYNCFVPLTEIPVIYEHIKGPNYKPIPKKQVIRDRNGHLLEASDPDFDMAPMMKIIGPDATVAPPKVAHETQFTDFGIDGASNAKYFYTAREFNLQMKTGPYSAILGPIYLVNTAAPKQPEIVKVTAILEDKKLGIVPAIELQLNAYAKNQNIKKIQIYRATSMQNALSIRTMDLVKTVNTANFEGSIWSVKDDFVDLGYAPYGDPLFYKLVVCREVKYNDRDGILVTEYQPSDSSKMTITNIVENYSPEAPKLAYYSLPINTAYELHDVTLKWNKTIHNGVYYLYKQNEKGTWIKIHEVQSNDPTLIVPLVTTDLATGVLPTQDSAGNGMYHTFKVVAENFAKMRSTKEQIISIYNPSTWNDISTI